MRGTLHGNDRDMGPKDPASSKTMEERWQSTKNKGRPQRKRHQVHAKSHRNVSKAFVISNGFQPVHFTLRTSLANEQKETKRAVDNFEKAAELFESEELTTSANQCKQKVAQFAAPLEQYQKAIEIYEEIARHSLNNNLLKYGVKGHLLNAGLCQLCKADIVALSNALERSQELDPTFSGTRECRLLKDIADAIDEEDVVKFTDVVKEFDSMTPLDSWKTTLLLRVKEKLKAKELEEDDLT